MLSKPSLRLKDYYGRKGETFIAAARLLKEDLSSKASKSDGKSFSSQRIFLQVNPIYNKNGNDKVKQSITVVKCIHEKENARR